MASENKQRERSSNGVSKARLIGIVTIVAFLLGLIPMWAIAHSRGVQRDDANRKVAKLELATGIASAALSAKRGEYEAARQKTSEFFTELRSDVDRGDTLDQQQRDAVRPLLAQRDELITLLARGDPASVDRLFGVEHDLVHRLNLER